MQDIAGVIVQNSFPKPRGHRHHFKNSDPTTISFSPALLASLAPYELPIGNGALVQSKHAKRYWIRLIVYGAVSADAPDQSLTQNAENARAQQKRLYADID